MLYTLVQLNKKMSAKINELEKILKSLANRRRLVLLARLKREPETTVGQLARKMQLSLQATSRHLITLERAGMLDKSQRGLEVFYRLAKPTKPFVEKLFGEL
jgi:ArsR family transcriptional regulator